MTRLVSSLWRCPAFRNAHLSFYQLCAFTWACLTALDKACNSSMLYVLEGRDSDNGFIYLIVVSKVRLCVLHSWLTVKSLHFSKFAQQWHSKKTVSGCIRYPQTWNCACITSTSRYIAKCYTNLTFVLPDNKMAWY